MWAAYITCAWARGLLGRLRQHACAALQASDKSSAEPSLGRRSVFWTGASVVEKRRILGKLEFEGVLVAAEGLSYAEMRRACASL